MESALPLSMQERTIYDQVLIEYWEKGNITRNAVAWGLRNIRQRYRFPVPISVMRIFHQEMQHHDLSVYGQAFLARLDQELVNNSDRQYQVIRGKTRVK
ncbi:hypothetical protein [Larkinella arboricola]